MSPAVPAGVNSQQLLENILVLLLLQLSALLLLQLSVLLLLQLSALLPGPQAVRLPCSLSVRLPRRIEALQVIPKKSNILEGYRAGHGAWGNRAEPSIRGQDRGEKGRAVQWRTEETQQLGGRMQML